MEIKDININEIEIKENSRLENTKILDLAKSIEEIGLLQPIEISEMNTPSNGFKYRLNLGHRRFAAIKELGWSTIPAIVKPSLDEKEILLRNGAENIQREDILVVEEGRIWYKLIKEHNLDIIDISKKVGIPTSRIKDALDIYSFAPKEYRDKIIFNTSDKTIPGIIPARTAISIIGCDRKYHFTNDEKSRLYDAALDGRLPICKMNLIGLFLKNGISVDEAIKLSEEYGIYTIDLTLKKEEIDSKMKKYNIKIMRNFFAKILKGEIKETFEMPKGEKNEIPSYGEKNYRPMGVHKYLLEDGDAQDGVYKDI